MVERPQIMCIKQLGEEQIESTERKMQVYIFNYMEVKKICPESELHVLQLCN